MSRVAVSVFGFSFQVSGFRMPSSTHIENRSAKEGVRGAQSLGMWSQKPAHPDSKLALPNFEPTADSSLLKPEA
jgi:hypothetical protein